MNFHVMTLFPEMICQGVHTSITGKAMDNGIISLNAVNIRDFSKDKHHHVDDYPYGGGAGMVMQPQPVFDCYESIVKSIEDRQKQEGKALKRPRVLYMTPQGSVFSQKIAENLALEEDLIFLCGHYEGVDERVLEEIVTDYLSIGDYVLTGGELPAMVMIDTISRLVPGVLNNEESAQYESFQDGLLEYPQYTRPPVFHDKKVPDILLTGNHTKIERWRHQKSVERTLERRPDLFASAKLDSEGEKFFSYAKSRLYARNIHDSYMQGKEIPDWIYIEEKNLMQWVIAQGNHILDLGLCPHLHSEQLKAITNAAVHPLDIAAEHMDDLDNIALILDEVADASYFDGLILKGILDRIYQKDAKKLLKKAASLVKYGGHVLIEIGEYLPVDETTKFIGKHMIPDEYGAVCNLETEIWLQIFKPYFKIVEFYNYKYVKSGKNTRIFKLTRKL